MRRVGPRVLAAMIAVPLITSTALSWPEYAKKSENKEQVKNKRPSYKDMAKVYGTSLDKSIAPPKGAVDLQDTRFSRLDRHSGNYKTKNLYKSYRKNVEKLDYAAVKADMRAVLTDSKDAWPADYGHYGPLFVRMAWHSAGTYRTIDGRGGSDGGQQRFYPLANWPDNGNLDKARELIRPVVEKYHPNLTWADAMILAGDIGMEDMGFNTLGVALGRVDDLSPDLVYWGPEDEFLESERFNENGELILPLAASVMGLIYVNPEGADGKPDPISSAERIRTTFGRMGMNDEETVALIVGGHSFGKAHGAPLPPECQERNKMSGKKEKCPEAKGAYTNTSGIEGPWTSTPIVWSHKYLENLFKYEWELTKGPGGKYQWYAKNLEEVDKAPAAHDSNKTVPVIMLTTDLSLKFDSAYKMISQKFLENPAMLEDAFARAWFKLVHRDLGPKSRYVGGEFPSEDFIWQDPIPAVDYKLVTSEDVKALENKISESKLSISGLVKTAWAAAASFRASDYKGGVNGARIRLAAQRSWEVNEPEELAENLSLLEGIQTSFNSENKAKGKRISLADLIVIAGNAGVKMAAKKAGIILDIPFTPGRNDATAAMTDMAAQADLELHADGFRNFYNAEKSYLKPIPAFLDRADQLTLTKREAVVLTAGLRVLGANHRDSDYGVLTENKGVLSNDYLVNLLSQDITWEEKEDEPGFYLGKSLEGKELWTATSQDLVISKNPDLRVIAYQYNISDAKQRFAAHFAEAWQKVMNLDRF